MTEQEWLASEDPQAMLKLRQTNCCGCWWTDNGNGTVSLCPGAKPCGQCDNGPILPYAPWSNRKLRLFACAFCRGIQREIAEHASQINAREHLDVALNALDVAEMFADGGVPAKSLAAVRGQTAGYSAIQWMNAINRACWLDGEGEHGIASATHRYCTLVGPDQAVIRWRNAHLIRDIIGNPFRPQPSLWVECDSCCTRGKWAEGFGPDMDCPDCDARGYLPGPLLTPTVLSLAQAAYEERREDGTLDSFRLALVADALEEAGCTSEELLAHLRSPGPHFRGCWVLDLILGKE